MEKITEKLEQTDEDFKVLSQKMKKYYKNVKAQVSQLYYDLRKTLDEKTFGKNFDQKEREIIRLQAQVKEMDDFITTSKEHKPKPVEIFFVNPPTIPTYFTQPERPSPFFPTYASSPPDYVKYISTVYRPKSAMATTLTSRNKGKTVCVSEVRNESIRLRPCERRMQSTPQARPHKTYQIQMGVSSLLC